MIRRRGATSSDLSISFEVDSPVTVLFMLGQGRRGGGRGGGGPEDFLSHVLGCRGSWVTADTLWVSASWVSIGPTNGLFL